ncbi:MAG: vWA domain-containing protein, partial [Clostridia bacterium]|nr:vWA domain-containing protein [Clostridia bacterium]
MLLITPFAPMTALGEGEATAEKVYTHSITTADDEYAVKSDSITLTEHSMISDIPDFKTSIESLSNKVDYDEPLQGAKYVGYESEADAQSDIVKISLDAVSGKQISEETYDVLFVMDQSGSMNMLSNNETVPPANTDYTSKYTSPCLNEDHYYRVPACATVTKNGVTKKQFYWFYFKPTSILADGRTAPWHEIGRTYLNAIKAKLETVLPEVEGKGATFAGIYLNHLYISERYPGMADMDYLEMDFDDEHYNAPEGTAETMLYRIETTGTDADGNPVFSDDGSTLFTKIENHTEDERYYSPNATDVASTGCIDRMSFAVEQLSEYAGKILASNTNNRVGLVTFAGSVMSSAALAAYDPANLPSGFSNIYGGDGTNYTAALTQALKLFNESEDKGHKKIVIFVTDGAPTMGTDKQVAAADALKAAGIEMRTIGISLMDDPYDVIAKLASTDENGNPYAANCKTTKDFENALEDLYKSLETTDTNITDILGGSFDLYVDDA